MSVARLTEAVLKGGVAQRWYAVVTIVGGKAFAYANFMFEQDDAPLNPEDVVAAIDNIAAGDSSSWSLSQYLNFDGAPVGPLFDSAADAQYVADWLRHSSPKRRAQVATLERGSGGYTITNLELHPHSPILDEMKRWVVHEAVLKCGHTTPSVLWQCLPSVRVTAKVSASAVTTKIGVYQTTMQRILGMSPRHCALVAIAAMLDGWVRYYLNHLLGHGYTVYPYSTCYKLPIADRCVGLVINDDGIISTIDEVSYDRDLADLSIDDDTEGPSRDYTSFSPAELLVKLSGGTFELSVLGADAEVQPFTAVQIAAPGQVTEAVLRGGSLPAMPN